MYSSTSQSPVLLVGAAHVIDLEVPLRRVLGERVLDGVAIELDAERAQALFSHDEGVRRSSGAPLFARLWSRVQERLGSEMGGDGPGAEMKVAAQLARERQLPLFLIDDPIRATLAELVRTMPFKERVSLLVSAGVALFIPKRFVEKELDKYSEKPEAFQEELRKASPTLAHVLLDERNEHMAERLAALRGQGYGRMAVVVGDAHVEGLGEALRRRGVPVEAIRFRELRGPTGPSPTPS
ncbi:MAG TPA: TraB/GumN family protein [Thermoplasmata archaeon]|nr:TraB/GumN family protein [Thermoplasmata archaeon]